MIEEGCIVEVVKSKSGYSGRGETLSIAYQDFWLVKTLDNDPKVKPVILVKASNLRLISGPSQKDQKKKKKTQE